eukprot:6231335-Pyramimonas_sp.AAC.1
MLWQLGDSCGVGVLFHELIMYVGWSPLLPCTLVGPCKFSSPFSGVLSPKPSLIVLLEVEIGVAVGDVADRALPVHIVGRLDAVQDN